MIHLSGYILVFSSPLPDWRLHIFILAVSGFHLKMQLLYFVAFNAGVSRDGFFIAVLEREEVSDLARALQL